MRFEKWHGIGNDFLIVREADLEPDGEHVVVGEDGRPRLADHAAVALCDRHFGVGADGVLVVGPSEVADERMLIHNADGSMAEMCGNGIRVVARFLVERSLVRVGAGGTFGIETAGGVMRPAVLEDGRVRVEMGELRTPGTRTVSVLGGEPLTGRVVDVGNPHFVVEREPDGDALHQLGPLVERDASFPHRTNVEFFARDGVDDEGRDVVRMRVWERGVGETLACGTGACAVALVAMLDGGAGSPVVVRLPGGELEIAIDDDGCAQMTGAAHEAWRGEVDVAALVEGLPQGHPARQATPA